MTDLQQASADGRAWTPGPWSLYRHSSLTVVGPDERTVASCGGYTNNVNAVAVDAENLANAALIAAAPDLYEALLAARDAVEGHFDDSCDVCREALDMIVAALAKATPPRGRGRP